MVSFAMFVPKIMTHELDSPTWKFLICSTLKGLDASRYVSKSDLGNNDILVSTVLMTLRDAVLLIYYLLTESQ